MQLGSSVLVDGQRLRRDRKASFPSAEQFSQVCGASVPTVYRAERGGPVRFEYLRGMARALKTEVEQYIRDPEMPDGPASIVCGRWSAYLIAADKRVSPYIVEEDVHLQADGDLVVGTGSASTPQCDRTKRYERCQVAQNVFYGTVTIDGWEAPSGAGSFVLCISRNRRWMEGFASWYDPDSDRVETSRYIMVRHEGEDFEEYRALARELMAEEMQFYLLRKNYEIDYKALAAAGRVLASVTR